jgi:cytochrome b561
MMQTTTWSAPAKFFHWLIAALVVAQVALGIAAISWRLSPTKLNLFVWHKSTGMLILALVALRLIWRLSHAVPALPADTPRWERAAARTSHFLLYVLLIAVPLSGWVIASASGIPFSIFWRIPLPEIVGVDKPTADMAARIHLWLVVAFAALLVVHVAAALRHHFVKRNDVLSRMLPLVLLAVALPVGAAEWRMDAAASRLDFAATFERTPAPGVFRQFDTRLAFDGDTPAGGRLEVSIRVPSADMANDDVNKAIAGPEWFDFARHPQATFQSAEIRRLEGNRYLARGTLTLKGQQRPVDVPFTWAPAGGAATMEGEFTVQRSAFGIGTGEWVDTNVIGPDVKVKFRVRLRKAG